MRMMHPSNRLSKGVGGRGGEGRREKEPMGKRGQKWHGGDESFSYNI